MINIPYPHITATTDKEQIAQIQSYLYQLAEQLNWALSTLESGQNGNAQDMNARGE